MSKLTIEASSLPDRPASAAPWPLLYPSPIEATLAGAEFVRIRVLSGSKSEVFEMPPHNGEEPPMVFAALKQQPDKCPDCGGNHSFAQVSLHRVGREEDGTWLYWDESEAKGVEQ